MSMYGGWNDAMFAGQCNNFPKRRARSYCSGNGSNCPTRKLRQFLTVPWAR